jgi:hypothetical protein
MLFHKVYTHPLSLYLFKGDATLNIEKLTTRKALSSMIVIIFLILALALTRVPDVPGNPQLSLTVSTNQSAYQLRQNMYVFGNMTNGGSPVSDGLVAVEIDNPNGYPFVFRGLSIGNPNEDWLVNITQTHVLNVNGDVIDKAEVNSLIQLYVTVHNNLGNEISVYITATLYDNDFIPIRAVGAPASILPMSNVTEQWSCYIPEWASRGSAYVFYNVYSNRPQNGGIVYFPEKFTRFYITQNIESGIPYSPIKNSYTTSSGKYNLTLRVPPDRYTLPNDYTIYVTGRTDPVTRISTNTTFEIQDVPSPPQASFTYRPLQAYANMTITLDASSSSAEGYNDTITRYEWTINDPHHPEHIINQGSYTNPPSPLAYHTFEYGGTYVVVLNVTDNEGLWSTTSKPVTIYPEFGPTANFTWSPKIAIINQTVTFDATSSKTGWSAKTKSFSPIQSYTWNFQDGTGNITITNATIGHAFAHPGNFTVKLTVTDAVNRKSSISYVVQVLNITAKYCDVNHDGIINYQDIYAAIIAFMTQPGDAKWNPNADVNHDGIVNMIDIYQIILHYMQDP